MFALSTFLLIKVVLQRDKEPIGFIAIQSQSVLCKTECLLIICQEINTPITHEKEGMLPQIQFTEKRHVFTRGLLLHAQSLSDMVQCPCPEVTAQGHGLEVLPTLARPFVLSREAYLALSDLSSTVRIHL